MAPPDSDSGFAASTLALDATELEEGARRWRTVLRAVFGTLVVLVWLTFAEHTAHEHRLALEAVAQRDSNLATAVEHYTGRVLRNALAVHRLLGSMLARGRSHEELDRMLADRLQANDAFVDLALCPAGGQPLQGSDAVPWLDAATCARLLQATPRGPAVAVLPTLAAAGSLQVPLATAIESDTGERLALAVALTPVETLLGIMQSVVLQDATAVVLVGADGQPRAAWHSQSGHVLQLAGFARLREVVAARDGSAAIDGQVYLVSSRELPGSGLRIQVATDRGDALAAFTVRRLRYLAVCTVATLALAGVYLVLSRLQEQGLRRARALQRTRGELEALNAGLDQQVRERTAQLEHAYRELEAFSYAVAHDVRTPLAAIAGFADALEPALAASGTERDRHYLQRIRANAARMEDLTHHLLELGRLTRTPLHRSVVDLSAMAEEVLAHLREREPQRAVEARVEPGLGAWGDAALLRQVLENLLGNAWKFSSRRPLAQIAFGRASGGHAATAFFVSDNGEGFDSEHAADLFLPFRRLHDASDFPGSGVGLATVQRIVALHGGEVWFEAREGEGARFSFSLATPPGS